VDVDLKNGFRQGATHRLFKLGPSEFAEDVAQDHRRFLVSERKDNSSSARLEVVLGWPQLIGGE